MNHQVHIEFKEQAPAGLRERLEQAAKATLEHTAAPDGRLTVVLTDEGTIRELNRRYANLDESTDVLSFPDGEPDPADGLVYLGDVLIALPVAQRQAQERGIDIGEELQVLVVHGALHLLGHDHAEPQEKGRMWAAQEAILRSLGVSSSAWETL